MDQHAPVQPQAPVHPQAPIEAQFAAGYAPAKPGRNWVMIAVVAMVGLPILGVFALIVMLTVVSAIGASASSRFDEVSAELNNVAHQTQTETSATPLGKADENSGEILGETSAQSDAEYDPFDL